MSEEEAPGFYRVTIEVRALDRNGLTPREEKTMTSALEDVDWVGAIEKGCAPRLMEKCRIDVLVDLIHILTTSTASLVGSGGRRPVMGSLHRAGDLLPAFSSFRRRKEWEMFRCAVTGKFTKPREAAHRVVVEERKRVYGNDAHHVRSSTGREIVREVLVSDEGMAMIKAEGLGVVQRRKAV